MKRYINLIAGIVTLLIILVIGIKLADFIPRPFLLCLGMLMGVAMMSASLWYVVGGMDDDGKKEDK